MSRLPFLALSAALALLTAGCFGGSSRLQRETGSAVWSESGEPVAAEGIDRLQGLGMGEVFVPFAELEWHDGSPSLRFLKPPELPRRTAVTLVVRGSWEVPTEAAAAAGEELTEELEGAGLRARSRGLALRGFHLEAAPPGPPALAALGEALAVVRRDLPREVFLSAGLEPDWLEREGAAELAAGVDFLVAWLYGQRPASLAAGGVSADLWDLSKVEQALLRLERLGTPYLVGVVTLASTLRLSPQGTVRGVSQDIALADLALDRSLRLSGSFVFSGADCRRYDFEVREPARVGGWRVEAGETLRSMGLDALHLREYHRRRAAVDLELHRGELYFRLPEAPAERDLAIDGLAAGVTAASASPELAAEVVGLRSRGRGVELRVAVANPLPQATEIVQLEANFVQLEVDGGSFGKVDVGGFHRYQLLRRGPRGTLTPTLRGPDVLRLFRPVLGPGERVESGAIQVRSRGGGRPRLRLGGRFLLASGERLELAPRPVEP